MKNHLDDESIRRFIHEGYLKIEHAFDAELAKTIRDTLWKEIPVDPLKPESWTQPVIRLGMYHEAPFVTAANTEILHQAFNSLLGENRWLPCRNMGSFVIRFPSTTAPADTGWHVDTSFPGDDPGNYMHWRANLRSKGRGLLMLFLFSDVGDLDAPTKIRVGSHLDVARLLQRHGERGLSTLEIASEIHSMPGRKELLATGKAGTVYLCHPFVVHAAQPHHGTIPRFLAQPPLFLKEELSLENPPGKLNAVEKAILLALNN